MCVPIPFPSIFEIVCSAWFFPSVFLQRYSLLISLLVLLTSVVLWDFQIICYQCLSSFYFCFVSVRWMRFMTDKQMKQTLKLTWRSGNSIFDLEISIKPISPPPVIWIINWLTNCIQLELNIDAQWSYAHNSTAGDPCLDFDMIDSNLICYLLE